MQEHKSLESFLSMKMKVMDPILCDTPMSITRSLTSKPKKVSNSSNSAGGSITQSVIPSLHSFCIHLLGTLSHNPLSQISIGSDGHSSSLPRKSEPRWGQSRSSRLPSLPGWWFHQNAPGRRCLWSARWRRAPRWWHRGPTSPRSASHTPLPASPLLDGSPAGSMSQV